MSCSRARSTSKGDPSLGAMATSSWPCVLHAHAKPWAWHPRAQTFLRFNLATSLAVLLVASASTRAQRADSLADAAEKKDRAQIAALIKQGVDVNASQADGMTALHWAAYHDDVSLVTQLLKSGARAVA